MNTADDEFYFSHFYKLVSKLFMLVVKTILLKKGFCHKASEGK